MKAIIPVAGSGTRLRPLTHSKPKALLRVGSKPILAHIIDSLLSIDCHELVLIISEEGRKIPEFVKEHYPQVSIETVVQVNRLGLGHAVSLAEETVGNGEILIMYGDTIIDGDIGGLVDKDVDGVFSVKEVEDPRRFGVVNIENGLITKFVEKPEVPQSNLAVVGLNYIKHSEILFKSLREVIEQDKKTKGEYQITDAFELMAEQGLRMKPYMINGWFDAGTQETLLATNAYMLKKDGNRDSLPGSIIIPPVFIPDNATIERSIIGPNVSVGDNAVIKRSIIGESIIGSGAQVWNACLTDSLVGDNAGVCDTPRKLAVGDDSNLSYGVSESN